jgi:hypothetical protein
MRSLPGAGLAFRGGLLAVFSPFHHPPHSSLTTLPHPGALCRNPTSATAGTYWTSWWWWYLFSL